MTIQDMNPRSQTLKQLRRMVEANLYVCKDLLAHYEAGEAFASWEISMHMGALRYSMSEYLIELHKTDNIPKDVTQSVGGSSSYGEFWKIH